MKTSQRGIELIKRFEGFRSRPYQCQAKVWTIGYGHTRGVTPETQAITRDYAEELLIADLARSERSVMNLVRGINQNQFDALVSFVFNLGGGALQRSTMRMKINRGEFDLVAVEFMRWTRAGGIVRKGLVSRRQSEANLFALAIGNKKP